jgi:translation initiation factor IF-2
LAATKRVHQIAKELGVDSKAIVAKCAAEGVPGIDTHMSPVKIGLEMTIREWFSESANATAVETADKVDLSQAKKARRKRSGTASKAKGSESDMDSGDEGGTATAVAEPEPTQPEATPRARPSARTKPVAAPAAPVEPTAPAPIDVPAPDEAPAPVASEAPIVEPPQVESPAIAAQAPAAPAAPKATAVTPAQVHARAKAVVTPAGRPNVPDRPTVIKPVGEKLATPGRAVLKGPKVVRIEQPDVIQTPRPRRTGGPGAGPATDEGITRSRGPARGRGAGAGPATPDTEGPARKRRSLNTRRGRSAEALPVGPTKFTDADLAELDARLNRAQGFLKQRRRDMKKHEGGFGPASSPASTGGVVEIAEPVTIKDLSAATGIKSSDIIKWLFKKGVMSTINSSIDTEAAEEIALGYDIELRVVAKPTAVQQMLAEFEKREPIDVRKRPPVVAVLGHVDHGKTSLLDAIRSADVAAHEAGGITQHVGAYRVTIEGGDGRKKTVVFLDTPGHQAFTSMRARGAQMTDLIVLVVAADDGVMPQTIESINHAKAAGVPIIVALNKIDAPQATEDNIRRIYGQLAEQGLNPTEWGGDTEVIKTSAIKKTGVNDLLEVLDYQAELKEYQADYDGPARGTVIESEMQEGRGVVGRLLVQHGKLKVGDTIVIGRAYGRVRDMTDDRGQRIAEAGPATPVEISGLDAVPDAGERFYVTESLQKAEQVAMQYRDEERERLLASKNKVTLETFADQLQAGQTKELRVVLKADVQGSIDVLRKTLGELGNNEVSVRVLHAAVGGITESDILLADASDAIVVGFHVIATTPVREIADERHVQIRLYRIIYELTDDIKKALEGLLAPEVKENELGQAEVREVFRIGKLGSVAGCMVASGVIQRSAKVRLIRDGVVVTDNRNIESLRRLKDDAREVRTGFECGIRLAGFEDIKPGDRIVCYESKTVARTLD